MSDSLQLYVLRHARLSCPSLPLGVCSNSCSLSGGCHPTISSSVIFSSCPQSFPASGSFPMSWLFTSGWQSVGASASVLPMNIQGWFPLGLTGLISLQVQGTLKSFLQHYNAKASILQQLGAKETKKKSVDEEIVSDGAECFALIIWETKRKASKQCDFSKMVDKTEVIVLCEISFCFNGQEK